MIDPACRGALLSLMPRAVLPVLRALSSGPLAGVEMDQAILSSRSDLTPSSIRYARRVLSEAGSISRARVDLRGDGRKRIYFISDRGRAVLAFLDEGVDRV